MSDTNTNNREEDHRMKFELEITASPKLLEAIEGLTEALSNKSITNLEVEKPRPEKEAKQEKSKKQESKKEEKQPDDTPPTKEEVRAKAAEVAKAGKKAELKDLLAEFDAGSVSLVPEDKRAEFITRLEEL